MTKLHITFPSKESIIAFEIKQGTTHTQFLEDKEFQKYGLNGIQAQHAPWINNKFIVKKIPPTSLEKESRN